MGRKAATRRVQDRVRGSITIFMVMVLAPMIAVSGLLVDGSRVQLAKGQAAAAGDLAMNAGLANYDTVLKDVYGLFAMSQNHDAAALEDALYKYFQTTLAGAGIDSPEAQAAMQSLFTTPAPNDATTMLKMEAIRDEFEAMGVDGSQLSKAKILRHQIVEFEKYRAPIEGILALINAFMNVKKQMDSVEAEAVVIKKQTDLNERAEEANEIAKKIWDLLNNKKGALGWRYNVKWADGKTVDWGYTGLLNDYVSNTRGNVFVTSEEYMQTDYSNIFERAAAAFAGRGAHVGEINRSGDRIDGDTFSGHHSEYGQGCSSSACPDDADYMSNKLRSLYATAKTNCNAGPPWNSTKVGSCLSSYEKLISNLKPVWDKRNTNSAAQDVVDAVNSDAGWSDLYSIYQDARSAKQYSDAQPSEVTNLLRGRKAKVDADLEFVAGQIKRLSDAEDELDALAAKAVKVEEANTAVENEVKGENGAKLECKEDYQADVDYNREHAFNQEHIKQLGEKAAALRLKWVDLRDKIAAVKIKATPVTGIDTFGALETALGTDKSLPVNQLKERLDSFRPNTSRESLEITDFNSSVNFYQDLRATFEPMDAGKDDDVTDRLDDAAKDAKNKTSEAKECDNGLAAANPFDFLACIEENKIEGGIKAKYQGLPSGLPISDTSTVEGMGNDGRKNFGGFMDGLTTKLGGLTDSFSNLTGNLGATILDLAEELRDNIYTTHYVMTNFSYATREAEEDKADGDDLVYKLNNKAATQTDYKISKSNNAMWGSEVEYILSGRDTPQDNVNEVVGKIFLIRFGINAIHAIADKGYDKKPIGLSAIIRPVAYAVWVASQGIIPVKLTEVILALAWAGAETASDLIRLRDGEGVGLLKKAGHEFDGWHTMVTWQDVVSAIGEEDDPPDSAVCEEKPGGTVSGSESTLREHESEVNAGSSGASGFTKLLAFPYSRYLQLFLMGALTVDGDKVVTRIGDVIQMNVIYTGTGSGFTGNHGVPVYKHERGGDFRMSDAYSWVRIDAKIRLRPLFIGLPDFDRLVTSTTRTGSPASYGPGDFEFTYSGANGY